MVNTRSRKLFRRKSKKSAKTPKVRKTFKEAFIEKRDKVWAKKSGRVRLHRSFRRSHYEDYNRPLEVPGLLSHAVTTFQVFFRNWKLFLPLIILSVVFNIFLVGLMSEDTYVELQETIEDTSSNILNGKLGESAKAGMLLLSTITTGGLSSGLSEVQQVFAVLLFLIVWLTTIYLVRHLLAGQKPKLRDGFYNAMTPFISTFVVLVIVLLQLIPIAIVVITYSAAVSTKFLETPFYALIFFIFAALLILLSVYWLSGSFLGLIAVTAPGLYPMTAVRTANDLIAGRRIKLLIRLVFLVFTLAVVWVIIMLPLILLDLKLKSVWDWLEGVPVVSFELLFMTVFSIVYLTIYSYLYYRRILDYDDEWVDLVKRHREDENWLRSGHPE